jgi:DNA-binding transcriptional LysR family regulator
MDRLAAMQILVRVVEAGSFSAIAREQGTTQSAISKQVAALEAHLGVRLLSRTTRAVTLTDEGRSYVQSAQRIVRDAQDAEDALRSSKNSITGRLRIGASTGFGRFVLFPIVQTFMEQHPNVEIDLQLKDSFVDVVAEGLDAVVRVGELNDTSLIAQRVGTAHRSVIANKKLAADLNRIGRLPIKPEDLSDHNCIIYTGLTTPNTWLFDSLPTQLDQDDSLTGAARVRVKGRFSTSSSEVVREAVLAGLGIGFTPNWFFTEELATGEVVRLLPSFSPHPLPIHALYPITRRDSPKLAAFVAATKAALLI